MIPTLAQVSSLNAPFHEDVEQYASAHCESLEIWLTKLEAFVEANSIERAGKLLTDNGIRAPVASYQGGLLVSQGEARREAWDLFRRRLDLCAAVGIETLVVACDVQSRLTQQDLERLKVSLTQIAQETGPRRLRAALEFQAGSVFGNNLQTAAALVAEVGSPHLGICFDAFQFYCGPSKVGDLGYLTKQNLFHVQLCDLADVPRELAADRDRILPGDGDIPLAPIIDRLRQIEYEGCVSVELMNPQIWQVPPQNFAEIGMTAVRKVLGQAAME